MTAFTIPASEDLTSALNALRLTHEPANAYEEMLLAQAAQCCVRLQRAFDLEKRYAQNQDMAETIRTKLDEFKAITRYITDCDRSWRHALATLEKEQRRRKREEKTVAADGAASQPERPIAATTTKLTTDNSQLTTTHSPLPARNSSLATRPSPLAKIADNPRRSV
jgi:hypothetical protein